jgi:uncharacterized protein with HEPN domain
MQREDRDIGFLWDMREAARDTLDFVGNINLDGFAANRVLRFAVERQLAVMGEAARQVSLAFRQAHPEIPWDAYLSP